MRKLFALLALILALNSPANAETFIVNKADSSGSGSLAWAVNSVNALTTSGHTISFDRSVKAVTLAQELTVSNTVSILGGGAALTGSGSSRLFTITDGQVSFSGLTFTKGYAAGDNGGAVKVEGSNASANFTNCTFADNQADGFGGAVCVTNGSYSPRTTLTHCTISGNLARNGGGFAILNGRAEITASIITGNLVSYDLYTESEASVIADYNVLGTASVNPGSTNLLGCSASEVFFTNELESVNGVEVLRLAGDSPARDFLDRSFGVETDQTGAPRPMLLGWDAGAFESRPVPVESVKISGLPYIQVNGTDFLEMTITPADASTNTITWRSSNPGVISVDNDGNISAVNIGSAYITAAVQGWDSDGREAAPVASNALMIYSGTEPRRPANASVGRIDNVSMKSRTYTLITPTVSLDINGITIATARAGTDYALSVSSARLDIVTADIISGDTVRLLAGAEIGSCDVTVSARALPDGSTGNTTFTVSVSESGSSDSKVGRSGGGGGCDSMFAGLSALIILLYRRSK